MYIGNGQCRPLNQRIEHHAQAHHHHRSDRRLDLRWLLLQRQERHGQEHPGQAHPCALG